MPRDPHRPPPETETPAARHDDFDELVRALVSRPPRRSPDLAQAEVLSRLRTRSPRDRRWGLAAAAAVAMGGALTSWWSWPAPTIEPPPPQPTAASWSVVVIPLDDGTPLYLGLAAP